LLLVVAACPGYVSRAGLKAGAKIRCVCRKSVPTMPVLPPEPDIFPDDLLEASLTGSYADQPWWAIYTLARREKDLMRRLRSLSIPFYAPLIKHRGRTPKGRVYESYTPLFPSYVFLCGGEEQRAAAMKTNCISRCLEVSETELFVKDLLQIKRLICEDVPLTVESLFTPGTEVRICSGSMEGLEGTVVNRRGKQWLVVMVKFLQQGVSVMLEDFQLEKI
jgi:transcriptional antiterminator RfaH